MLCAITRARAQANITLPFLGRPCGGGAKRLYSIDLHAVGDNAFLEIVLMPHLIMPLYRYPVRTDVWDFHHFVVLYSDLRGITDD